jgi:branched-chain amino acid aminotransferase
MINFDGTCYHKLSNVPYKLINYFSKLPIHTHHFIAFNRKLIQLEANYFSIMAALRRSRVIIPMKYTLEYFQDQAELIIDDNKATKYSLILIQFYRNNIPTKQVPISECSFYMQNLKVDWKNEAISLTLYKDHSVLAGVYSNLFQTNEPLRKLAEVFAFENDFEACLLINNEKKIVESTRGAVFLIFDNKIYTPPLSSGVVNSVSRELLIDFISKNNSYEIIEEEIPVFNLQRAEEIFLFSFQHGLTKIIKFRKKVFGFEKSKTIEGLFSNHLGINFEMGFQEY